MYNDLIKRLRETESRSKRALLDEAAQAIEKLEGRWISASERLPESDGTYIVTACDEGCSCGEGIWYDTVVVVAEYYRGSWTWYEGETDYDWNGIVTHWMPLPEPPKEVK